MRNVSNPQPAILAPLPPLARYLSFQLAPNADPRPALAALRELGDVDTRVIGLGSTLVRALGADVPGLRELTPVAGPGVAAPVTPTALWCWLHGDDRGELVHAARALEAVLAPAFQLSQVIDAFQYRDSRDLSGYVDGTENPTDDDAVATAMAPDGSSFVAVQQWIHDLQSFEARTEEERDHVIGRRISDNEEIDDAPPSAHVKRTAQEDFDPPAFIVRRSMPWADEQDEGLVFVAFGRSLDAFEQLLCRMLGRDDGVLDALFSFTRPVTGCTLWCPPVKAGRLDLSAVGL